MSSSLRKRPSPKLSSIVALGALTALAAACGSEVPDQPSLESVGSDEQAFCSAPCGRYTCGRVDCLCHPINDGSSCGVGAVCKSGGCITGCYIGGAFVPPGAADPANSCLGCVPSTSTTTWSAVNDGTGCGVGAVCASGACTPGCYIDKAFMPPGATYFANRCLACIPSTSTTTWSALNDGTSCGVGEVCGSGACNVGCAIGGAVVPYGAIDPSNSCLACMAYTSTTTWSAIPCTASDSCHAVGTCTPGVGCSNPVVPIPPAGDICHLETCNPAAGVLEAVCGPIDHTVASNVGAATSFLYSGPSPIQTGVLAGTIDPARAALVRGRVTDPAGNPLAAVTIAIQGHPEFGQTTTVTDGTFSLAVNGGGSLVVSYGAARYLPVQRSLANVAWNSYAVAPDVVLTALDDAVTPIVFGAGVAGQVARANPVTDASGARRATLFIPPGTQALVGGNPTTSLSLRATEYTVGPNGPAAVPGTLPAMSGYTYAIEFSDDGALASGSTVTFSAPVVSYTENFLGFNVGQRVPVGTYDRTASAWLPASADGLVIGILSATNGLANVDLDGSGTAASAASLAAVGITPAEQATLANLYAGRVTSIWRVPLPHFSAWDFNWPFGPPPGASGPAVPPPAMPPGGGSCQTGDDATNGSAIDCESGILHESIPLAGTPYTLNYAGDRVSGYTASKRAIIPLTGATVPAAATGVSLEVDIAGRSIVSQFPATANESTTFDWDGIDAFGRLLQGAQVATISVGYVYPGTYFTPGTNPGGAAYDSLFGHYSYYGTPATGDRTRQTVTLWSRSQLPLGQWGAEALGLGGWTVSPHHTYDFATHTLFRGDGTKQTAEAFGRIVTTFAGTGATGAGGDGGPAAKATLNNPWSVSVAPDGSLFIADRGNSRIRKVSPSGVMTTVAGTGTPGFSGDNGLATSAQLANPEAVAAAPDGSFYIADVANQRIRKVDPSGIITTYAGTGAKSYGGDGGKATSAAFWNPNGLFLAPDGSLYIADSGNSLIRKVDPSTKIISTVAGVPSVTTATTTTCAAESGDGGNALNASMCNPHSVVLSPDGALFIADRNNNRIRRVGVDGIITTFAGTGVPGDLGDGGPASAAQLNQPQDIALGPDGTLYIADHDHPRIRAVRADGIITTIAGNGQTGFAGDQGPALMAQFSPGQFHFGLATSSDGHVVYIADGSNNRIRALSLAQPSFTADAFSVAAEDGSEVYSFDASGRHLSTTALPTNVVTTTFGYDLHGLLSTITDGNGNVTTIHPVNGGTLQAAIVGPFGVTTQAALGPDGHLGTVVSSTGGTYKMGYAGGLLTTIQFPTGSLNVFSGKIYDALGRIVTSTSAAGRDVTFNRLVDAPNALQMTKVMGSGVTTSFVEAIAPAGDVTKTITYPGATSPQTQHIGVDGTQTITAPDGTKTTLQSGPDPRFGMQAPVVASETITTPSGLTETISTSRAVILSDPNDPLSLVSETDTTTVNGLTTALLYTPSQRTLQTKSPTGRLTTVILDPAGHPTQIGVPEIAPTVLSYDSQGRLRTTTQGTFASGGAQVPATWTFGYDANGYANSVLDPNQITTSSVNDLAGRPTTTFLPDGLGGTRSLGTGYDLDGNLASVTLPGGAQHILTYNPADAIASYVPPSLGAGTWSTRYDYNGGDARLSLETRPDATTIASHYDPVSGKLQTLVYPQGTITRTYDPATGQLKTIATPGGELMTLNYDGFLDKGTTWSGTVAGALVFGYDSLFRKTSQTLNGAGINFGYDNDNLMTQAGALTITRDPLNGKIIGTTLAGVTDSYGYDGNGALQTYVAMYGTTPLYAENITLRDGVGRILERTESIGAATHAWKYGYDTAGRLQDVTEDGVALSHYTYDAHDNRASVKTASGTIIPGYDAQDRLVSYGSTGYSYGANGELQTKTSGGQNTAYVYDVFGNLLSATLPDGTALAYVVDGQNRRVGKRVNGTLATGFLYQDQLNAVAQLDGNGNLVSRFVFGSKPNVPDYYTTSAGTFRILSDHLGSPRLVVNIANGSVFEQIDYDEFGNVTNDTAPGTIPFGFAGGLRDLNTGLVRFGARDYDPVAGRWTAKDGSRFGGGVNLYNYCYADPVNCIDRTGYTPIPIPIWIPPWLIPLFAGAGEGGEVGSLGGPVGAIVGAAAGALILGVCLSSDNAKDEACKEEWAEAEARCEEYISNPQKYPRGLTGGYTNVKDCAKGFVSERCGGNPTGNPRPDLPLH